MYRIHRCRKDSAHKCGLCNLAKKSRGRHYIMCLGNHCRAFQEQVHSSFLGPRAMPGTESIDNRACCIIYGITPKNGKLNSVYSPSPLGLVPCHLEYMRLERRAQPWHVTTQAILRCQATAKRTCTEMATEVVQHGRRKGSLRSPGTAESSQPPVLQ